MYAFISKFMPQKMAIPVAAFLYALMLLAILYASFEEQATFSYLNL